jgi:hypothetical protein
MSRVTIRFIVGELIDDDVMALKNGQAVISKMILSHEDRKLFSYEEGDSIEVESEHGYRHWCRIDNLELIEKEDGVIVIFTLI